MIAVINGLIFGVSRLIFVNPARVGKGNDSNVCAAIPGAGADLNILTKALPGDWVYEKDQVLL